MRELDEIATYRTTRRAALRGGVALIGAGAVGFAVGRPALAQDATPASGGDIGSLGLPEITITVNGTSYEGVPSSVSAGRYLVTIMNNSSASTGGDSVVAGFMQLPEGVTIADLSRAQPVGTPDSALASPVASGQASPAADSGEEGGPPPWFYTTALAGGPSAAPGQTVRGIIDLTPGNWIVWGEDPSSPVAPAALTVTGDASATPGAAGQPSADVEVDEVTTGDGFAFQVNGSLQPGTQLLQIRNLSTQPHFLLAVSSPVPLTMDQVMTLLQLPDGATPDPSTGLPDPNTFQTAVYAGTQSPGTTQWIEANLQDGTYVLLCFVPDPTRGGTPHAAEGMAEILTVGTGAMATPTS